MVRPTRTALLVLIFVLLMSGSLVRAQQLLTKDNEKIDFAQGLLAQSMFALASVQYEEFIQQFPQSTFLDDAYLGAAESRFFLKEYERAAGLYQKYLEQFPAGKSRGIAFVRLGQSFYLLGKYDDAFKQLTAANHAELAPPFVQTLNFYSGQVRAAQGNAQEAAAYFEKAAQVGDATAYTAQAYLQWASALSRAGNYPVALEKAAKAFELAASDEFKVSVLMKQGEIYFLSNDFLKSAGTFRNVVENFPLMPSMPDAAANWFTALYNQKQFDELAAQYDQRFKDRLETPLIPVHMTAAKGLAAAGKNDEALALLDKISALPAMTEGQKAKAHLTKVDLLVRLGRYQDALDSFNGQIADVPNFKAPMAILKAKSFLGLKQYDNAWTAYQGIAAEFPGTPVAVEAVCGLGHVRYAQAQYEESANLFLDCSAKSGDDASRADALYNVLLAHEKAGMADKAIEDGEAYLKNYSKGERVLDVGLVLAGLYAKGQQYDKSIEILTPLTRDPDESRRKNAQFQIAFNLQMSGRVDEAILGYGQLINEHKNADQVYYLSLKNSFILYLQKKDEAKAADMLTRAAREFESNDISLKQYLWLAQYWQDQNDPQTMKAVLDAAQKIHAADPGAVGIKYFQAESQRLSGDVNGAIVLYDEVIAANNTVYKGRAYLGKSMCLAANSDFASAQSILERAISENPEDNFVAMRSRFELARNAEIQKKLDEAAKMYMVVAVLYKDLYYSPEALMRAGLIFQQLNNNVEALGAWKQIISAFPETPQAANAKQLIAQIK